MAIIVFSDIGRVLTIIVGDDYHNNNNNIIFTTYFWCPQYYIVWFSESGPRKGFERTNRLKRTHRGAIVINSFSRGDRTSAETDNRPGIPLTRLRGAAADGRTFLYIVSVLCIIIFLNAPGSDPRCPRARMPQRSRSRAQQYIMIIIIIIVVVVVLLLYIFCNTRII